MSKIKFTPNGVIGASGKFYECGMTEHIQTSLAHKYDAPFAIIRTHGGLTTVEFEAYYTVTKDIPTQSQFETLMDWCSANGEVFEDVVDCWSLPWQKWLG